MLNVLYQSNDNYASITGISILSLLTNNKDIEEINILVLDDSISQINKDRIQKVCDDFGRKLIFIDSTAILNKLKELKVSPFKGTYTTYFKLIALDNLSEQYDRILQLDGDTIIEGSLKPLITEDIENCVCAATYDCTMNGYKKFINIPETDEYYNCGVLLVNLKEWKKQDCTNKIINHLTYERNGYYTVDQDIINVLFRKQIKYLDIKYNYNSGFFLYGIKGSLKLYNLKPEYYNTVEEIEEASKNIVLYHCMGAMSGRPWEKNSIHPQNALFDKYWFNSPWKDDEKKTPKRSKIFAIQRFLYLHLPLGLYIPFHKTMQWFYLNNMNKKVQGK